jgi:hypothetical protein
VVDRALKKFFFKLKLKKHNLLDHFIHFQLQNNVPICPQITSKVKYPMGVSDSARKYFSWPSQCHSVTASAMYAMALFMAWMP